MNSIVSENIDSFIIPTPERIIFTQLVVDRKLDIGKSFMLDPVVDCVRRLMVEEPEYVAFLYSLSEECERWIEKVKMRKCDIRTNITKLD